MRFTARILAATLVLSLAAAPALARAVKVPGVTPSLSVEVPKGWESKEIDRGIQLKTEDEEVFTWIEGYKPAEQATIIAEHDKYFKEQGVAVTGDPTSDTNRMEGGVVKFTSFPATHEGKPTVLQYISIEPADAAKSRVLISYWASPEGDKQYSNDMGRIIDSLK